MNKTTNLKHESISNFQTKEMRESAQINNITENKSASQLKKER